MSADQDVIIIGGGLAGLSAARTCAAAGIRPMVLEAAGEVGGRLATEEVDGFLLDRGFQVLLDSYPEARRALDVDALELGRFAPGALIWRGTGFRRVADPWRDPIAGARSLVSGLFTPSDAWRMLGLRSDAILAIEGEREFGEGISAARALAMRGFSNRAIEGFFRPFFGGVFLDTELNVPAPWFEFLFGMFATGSAALPAHGMRAIPQQLASALPPDSVHTNTRVTAIRDRHVELASGLSLSARAIIVATDAQQAAALMPGFRAPAWSGCVTLYYAAPESPVDGPLLMLDGDSRRGPVNHVCVPSEVAAGYAPAGQALVSATVIGAGAGDDAALDRDARAQLSEWFGKTAVRSWRLLRVVRVPHSLPRTAYRRDTLHASVRRAPGHYGCGDHLETPSINGALRSGRRAAEAMLADWGVRNDHESSA